MIGEAQTTSTLAANPFLDKDTPEKSHDVSAPLSGAATVSTLPAQSATLRDVLAAVDDALGRGDTHRARRLMKLARELEDLGVSAHKGGRDVDEG